MSHPSKASIRGLVLDFDGVVLESVGIKTDAFRELFQEHADVIDDIVAYHLKNNGVSRFVKFEHIYRHFLEKPFDDSERARVGERFSRIVFRRVVECPFVPGARELLETFAPRIPIYVASASPHEELKQVIAERGLERFFVEVYGYPHSKREVIRRAATAANLVPGELLYVGDSIKDFEAAHAEGVSFVGRRNEENLEALRVPLFDDLVGVGVWLSARLGNGSSENGG